MLGRPYGLLPLELLAESFHLDIELMGIENLVQPIIEGIRRGLDYIAGYDPQILLPFPFPPRSHGHVI
jgi:hypothetical protein